MARSAAHRVWYVCVATLLVSTAASAQSIITGTVRDVSGAAMPGVTVEAASPVLIEKVKSVVSDNNGSYRITDLRPGVYTVTFTLTGFSTYRRDGLELPADFTATLNAELKVGSLEETITVTGESPIVDVSSTSRVQVLSVTHAPQVAARADTHLLISKGPTGDDAGRIATRVATMNEAERREEIARMLAGASITEEARAAAGKLLKGGG